MSRSIKSVENELSFVIRGAIFDVYNTLGPGLLESTYEKALNYELENKRLIVKSQVPLPVVYHNLKLDVGYRVDLMVEQKVLIEIKSVENIHEVHHKQILTYLRHSQLKHGILVNFNCAPITEGIFRKVNNL